MAKGLITKTPLSCSGKMKAKFDVYGKDWRESEKTAENGWFYDKTFGTKIEVVRQTVPTISLNE